MQKNVSCQVINTFQKKTIKSIKTEHRNLHLERIRFIAWQLKYNLNVCVGTASNNMSLYYTYIHGASLFLLSRKKKPCGLGKFRNDKYFYKIN